MWSGQIRAVPEIFVICIYVLFVCSNCVVCNAQRWGRGAATMDPTMAHADIVVVFWNVLSNPSIIQLFNPKTCEFCLNWFEIISIIFLKHWLAANCWFFAISVTELTLLNTLHIKELFPKPNIHEQRTCLSARIKTYFSIEFNFCHWIVGVCFKFKTNCYYCIVLNVIHITSLDRGYSRLEINVV